MLGSSLTTIVCGRVVSYLLYLCLFVHGGVKHIVCCVFVLFVFVLLPVSLDCPFLIASSVFSNVYFICLFVSIARKGGFVRCI